MRTSTSRWRSRIPAACVLSTLLIVATIPMGAALAEPGQAKPIELTLERLSDVLGRLEAELAALDAPAAERLEEGLERIIELVGDLLAELDRPRDEADAAPVGARIIKLDLMLHRLLYVLDEIVENSGGTPARPRAQGALGDLRDWVAGYIEGATAGMTPREAARFEKAVHEMIRSLAQRLADMAHRVQTPDRGRPVLARLVEQLEDLLFRLDGFILQQVPQPPPQE